MITVKVTLDMKDVKKAVNNLKKDIESENSTCNISKVDYDALKKAMEEDYETRVQSAINEEYDDDKGWTLVDVLNDFNDSIGLSEFGFEIE